MINLCRIRWMVNMYKWEKWKCKPIALWAVINDDFQYHIMAHLCNDYPPMVITYCCLAKGNPGLIWLHVNRVYVWENVSRVWESGNRKTWGTARWGARRNKRAFYTMMQCPISFLCWLRSCSLLVLGHTSPHIPPSSSHHGTWQRSSICSLKFNLTTYGTVVLPGVGGQGRERWKCGSDGGRGVAYCKTMYQRVHHYLNFCVFKSLLCEALLCGQRDS